MTGGRPRLDGLDALKGLLVLSVVVGHFPVNLHGVQAWGGASDWIYFVHVPLFLALSCLFVPALGGRWALRRAAQILVPYLLWGLLAPPWSHWRPEVRLGALAMGTWASLGNILWFLPALFTLNFLAALGRRGLEARGATRGAVLGLLGAAGAGAFLGAGWIAPRHVHVPFGLDVACYLLPFTVAMAALWALRSRVTALSRGVAVPLALGALVAGAWLIRVLEPLKTHSPFLRRVDFAQFSVPVTAGGHLGLVLMGAGLLVLALCLPAPRILAALGRYSLPIYLLHYPVLALGGPWLRVAGTSRPALTACAALLVLAAALLPMGLAWALLGISPRFAWAGMAGRRPSPGPGRA